MQTAANEPETAFPSLVWQAVLGGFAACLATIFAGTAGMLITGTHTAEIPQKYADIADSSTGSDGLHLPLIVAPVLETFLFLFGSKALKVLNLARERRSAMLALALTMAIVGWLIHGASSFTVAQASGYAVLGALFASLWFGSGGVSAFAGTAIAHAILNASIYALALAYLPMTVWESRVSDQGSGNPRVHVVGTFATLDQCRRAGLSHLRRQEHLAKARPGADAHPRMTCGRR